DAERQRLAGAGTRLPDDVLAVDGQRERKRLNGKCGVDARGFERGANYLVNAEIAECHRVGSIGGRDWLSCQGVPPCAERLAPAPPSGTRHPGTASMSTRTGITTFQCPLALPTVPDGELDDVAEAHAARLVAAELHEGDLVGWNEYPAALQGAQCEDGGPVLGGECRRQVTLDLFRRGVGVHDELARNG